MKQEISTCLFANIVLPGKKKLIKFVDFIAMLLQNLQSGIDCGIALRLGSISLLKTQRPLC